MNLKDRKTENFQLLNENIPFSQLLLIVSKEEKEIVTRQEALNRAQEANLDLYCITLPTEGRLPVCKLIDYKKYLFELGKKSKPHKESTCKEMRFSFNIGGNDLKVKTGKIKKWVEEGFPVKVSLVLIGKEKFRQELAQEKCQKIIVELKNQSSKIELRDNIKQHLNTLYFFLYKKK
ncbi:MAG: Translation initiation factor IF-3 [Mycoplasmataceae bacterium]|nr:MAG: Translation initiation factor IF-3 [Mycoplasmataceae bacterium]